jgi:PAS domain S-box-containing protein
MGALEYLPLEWPRISAGGCHGGGHFGEESRRRRTAAFCGHYRVCRRCDHFHELARCDYELERSCAADVRIYEGRGYWTPDDIDHPLELRDEENDIEDRVAAGERIEHYETVRIAKNGSRIDASVTVSTVRDAAGTIIGASKIARDITERKQAEEELRQREARLAAEVDALAKLDNWSSRLWRMKDLREGLDEMLRAVMELLGANKGNVQLLDARRGALKMVAQSGFDKLFLDHYGEVSIRDPTACGRALRLGERVVVEDIETDARDAASRSMAHASGYRAVVSVPLISAEGSPLGVLSTHFLSAHRPTEESLRCLDLYTRQAAGLIQRCEAERALEDSEQRFPLVANTAPVMIWMADVSKQCTYFNEPWLKFTGRTLDSELANGWIDGVHPDDLEGCLDTYGKSFDQRRPFRMECRLRHHDGEYRWVLDIGVPRLNADGSFAGYIGSCIDVTERKLTEDALASLSGRLIEAEEEERKRIACEIHDDYQQRLALVADDLERLAEALPS